MPLELNNYMPLVLERHEPPFVTVTKY
jgi:hypothetical protein